MKYLLIINLSVSALFFFTCSALSQLEINEKSTKKANKEVDTSQWDMEVYALANWSNTFRKLQTNEGLFGKELGERENEMPVNTWSYGIGFRSRISSFLAWEGGISYLANGETYRFEDQEADSIFEYSIRYNYIAMPVRLDYFYGGNFGFLVSAGLVPQMFVFADRTENWKGAENTTGSEEIKIRSGFNSFVLSAVVSAGGYVRFSRKWVLSFIPEYRMQLTSSYLKTDPYKHYGKALGFNISLGMQL